MLPLRFEVGDMVMCNLGQDGWGLGRVIALHYREPGWPTEQVAPYQVALEEDRALIYVPQDDPRYCREATRQDAHVARRPDTLAMLPDGAEAGAAVAGAAGAAGTKPPATSLLLGCPWHRALDAEPDAGAVTATAGGRVEAGVSGYRDGRCRGCDRRPRCWSCVELYSEHYRGAERNGLAVTRRAVDLGTVRVGDSVHRIPPGPPPAAGGFLQAPTLARLPPGLTFSDDGGLTGAVRYDPHRPPARADLTGECYLVGKLNLDPDPRPRPTPPYSGMTHTARRRIRCGLSPSPPPGGATPLSGWSGSSSASRSRPTCRQRGSTPPGLPRRSTGPGRRPTGCCRTSAGCGGGGRTAS